jgi:hypothetical protein
MEAATHATSTHLESMDIMELDVDINPCVELLQDREDVADILLVVCCPALKVLSLLQQQVDDGSDQLVLRGSKCSRSMGGDRKGPSQLLLSATA